MRRRPRLLGGRRGLAIATALLGPSFLATADASASRNVFDEETVRTWRQQKPQQVERLERGEQLAQSGDFEGALALFRQGEGEDPQRTLFARRSCEVLVVMRRTAEAVTECFRALQSSDSSMNVRATVRALVSAPEGPTSEQLQLALTLVNRETRRAPGTLATVAATCDIAERIGDGVMLEHCAHELGRMAPDSPEARRAQSMLSSRCPPTRFWLGWASILAAVAGTLAHAAWLALRRGRRAAAPLPVASAVVVVVAALLATAASSAHADESAGAAVAAPPAPTAAARGWLSTKWPIDEDHPEEHIPPEAERDKDPLEFGYWLQDIALKAAIASKRGDHAASIRFWGALAKAAPDRAIAVTKICDEYEAMGDRDNAIKACGAALLRDGLTVKDYARYVHLVLATPGKLTREQIESLNQVLDHMKEDATGRDAAFELECQVGTKTENTAQLEECTKALAEKAPSDPATLTYTWALAMQKGQTEEARRVLQRARESGMQPDVLARMDQAIGARRVGRLRTLLLAAGGALALAGAAALIASRLRRRTATPNPA